MTGGSGFLGSRIARRLVDRGEQVAILDVWEAPDRPPEAEFIECDIRDVAGVAKAVQGVDVIHHNVALVPLTKSGRGFWDVNVTGSRILAEQAARAGVRGFIHMSSSAVFGVPQELPITATTPPHPVEIYGRAKLAGEILVRRILDPAGVPLVVIRPRTILGEERLGIFGILFDWIHQNRNVYTIGDGRGGFQFVHTDDLMDAYMLALDAGRSGVYNVGTDRFGSLRDALENLIDHAGSSSRVVALPERASIAALRVLDAVKLSPLAPWHYLTYSHPFYFDVSPLQELGWQPVYSNDEMLAQAFDWFVSHQEAMAAGGGSPHRKAVPEKMLALVRRLS